MTQQFYTLRYPREIKTCIHKTKTKSYDNLYSSLIHNCLKVETYKSINMGMDKQIVVYL